MGEEVPIELFLAALVWRVQGIEIVDNLDHLRAAQRYPCAIFVAAELDRIVGCGRNLILETLAGKARRHAVIDLVMERHVVIDSFALRRPQHAPVGLAR